MTFQVANDLLYLIVTKWKITHAYSQLNMHVDHLATTNMDNFTSWVGYLQTSAKDLNIYFLEKEFSEEALLSFVEVSPLPLIVFRGKDKMPVLLGKNTGSNEWEAHIRNESSWEERASTSFQSLELRLLSESEVYDRPMKDKNIGMVYTLIPMAIEPVVSEAQNITGDALTPMQRFFRLISTEKKTVAYIYVYALVTGLLGLTLPLGVQSIIGMISGGLILNSVILLISFVIIGTLVAGLLQIMQMNIVEILQRRLFVRAAFEFAFRIPRINMEAILKHYAPELVNRFFDILTLQKGFAKLLTDLITSILQALFGLVLLSFYHPIFVFFDFSLLIAISLLFYFTAPKGLKTSLDESKYKYQIAHWLEEIARTLTTFKLAGNTILPMNKMNEYLAGYLYKRKTHFNLLVVQYGAMVTFKTLITGGVLIIGSLLVVERQITLGQFVASEIVIISVVNSIEKLILNMDTVYDVLTAVEKIGSVTDLPLEGRKSAVLIPKENFWLKIKDLRYRYPGEKDYVLKGVTMEVPPKQHIGIIGTSGAGKTTLMHVITGLLFNYEGIISYNGCSLRDVNLKNLRDFIGDNLSHEDIFDGTILENITVGRQNYSSDELRNVLQITELEDLIHSFPDGLNTRLLASGQSLTSSSVKKIILARSLLNKPKIIVFDDFFYNLEGNFKKRVLDRILDKNNHSWSVLAISHDPLMLRRLDKIYIMHEGVVVREGSYQECVKDSFFRSLISIEDSIPPR